MIWGFVFSPSFLIFSLLSLGGVIFVVFSSGLIGVWVSLELSFFGFLPILNGSTVAENEGGVKYFIVQGVGSAVMLVGFLLMVGDRFLFFNNFGVGVVVDLMVVSGFMIKLGVFPFHFWFPSVMSVSSWFSCFWLSVTQKVGPFWGLSGLGLSAVLMNSVVWFLVLTSIVGAFGGLAQVQFRPLLAYSSLGQAGWMGLISVLDAWVFVLYMSLYSVLLGGLLSCLNATSSYKVVDMPGWSGSRGLYFWVFSGSFFISLGGLPPMAGSALKLVGVMTILASFPGALVFLIFSSMVSLYYYLSIFVNSVVCLGGSSYSLYGGVSLDKGVGGVVSLVAVINWVGGLPLFCLCGLL
uniref:NADH-ubiquinone oxidoreductase chain 2 n=1 Tax=Semele scabra TaxID=1125679 RepID=I6NJC9_9BIVA|nr:NADH dehydrogenase subunit 2 [Semele scabra]AEV94314.1 NADH dehydrogenase subunit 2 [Semele scabra]